MADLGDWISRQETRRRNAYFFAEMEKIRRRVARTSIRNVRRELERYEQNKPASHLTVTEAVAQKAIFTAGSENSQYELNEGNPENPHWHADHIQWIEQMAETLGIPLDTPDNES